MVEENLNSEESPKKIIPVLIKQPKVKLTHHSMRPYGVVKAKLHTFCTEGRGRMVTTPALFSGSPGFKSRSGEWLF
jgi:hypothetical protein